MPRLVGKTHMKAFPVGVGVDRDRAHSLLATSANDTDSDLAAISNEYFPEHSEPGVQFEPQLPREAARYKGMLPCFFGGFLSRFVSRDLNAVMSFALVWRGAMISSTYPRSAAT